MNLVSDKRMEMYHKAPENIQELYGAKITTDTLKQASISLDLQEPDLGVFVETIGDIILGMYSKDLLSQLLKDRLGLSAEKIDSVIPILSPLLEKIPDQKAAERSTIITQPSSAPANPTPNTPGTGKKSASAGYIPKDDSMMDNKESESQNITNKPNKLQGMRTFAKDVERSRAHGYGAFRSSEQDSDKEIVHKSSQEETLRKGKGSQ